MYQSYWLHRDTGEIFRAWSLASEKEKLKDDKRWVQIIEKEYRKYLLVLSNKTNIKRFGNLSE